VFDFEKWAGTGVHYCQMFLQRLCKWQIRELRHIMLGVVELNLTREQVDSGWIDLCKTLGGQGPQDVGLRCLRLTIRGCLFSGGAKLLDVDSGWVADGLVNLKALQSLEMVIASDGIEIDLVKSFSEKLQQVLQRVGLAIRMVERGLVCTIV
jgi:hypothetical protein